MACSMLYLPLHLTQSALGETVEAKPVGESHRERSQGLAAMPGHEVACLPGAMGLPLGRSQGRASPLRAKSGLSATLIRTGLAAANAVNGAPMVPALPAITSHTGNVRLTDEVPRRLRLPDEVTAGYKSQAKGQRYAPVAGTVSLRPRLQGCQQRQSRGPVAPGWERLGSERQNLCVPGTAGRFMGPVSPSVQATQWPGGTSSRPTLGALRNRPQKPVSRCTAVGSS